MADCQQIHLTFYKNVQSPTEAKDVLVKSNSTKAELLSLSSQLFGIAAKRLYSQQGKPVESFEGLGDGAVLYVSQGEAFQVRKSTGASAQANNFSITMLGASAVGKSAITLRYVSNKFTGNFDPTIEDFYSKIANIDNSPARISILDTAGMEDYASLIDHWIEGKDAFVLVCSVEYPQSIERLREFYHKVMHRYEARDPQKAPVIVIAANKIDLPSRYVTSEQLSKLSIELGGIRCFEVSAQANVSIEEMFEYVIRELRKRRVPPALKPPKPWFRWCSLL